MPLLRRQALMLSLTGFFAVPAVAQTPTPTPVFTLTIRNQAFAPASLEIPANQKIELRITNADAKPVEFESKDMRREKIVAPGQTASLFIGPLRPGRYEFYDDFRPATRGHLIAR